MGFTFNGQHSDDLGLYFKTQSLPVIAEKRVVNVEVQGRDGQYVFEDGFNNILIEISCVIIGKKAINRRKQVREVAAWLAQTGELIFDTEDDIVYEVVRTVNGIAATLTGAAEDFPVIFECAPVQVNNFYNDGVTWNGATRAWEDMDFPWEGYPRTFVVGSGQTIQVVNIGTYKALPIIKLTGTASGPGSTLTVGDFSFTGLDGIVYIDCKNMLVYSLDGSTKVNRISTFEGEFPELAPGTNEFYITGDLLSLTIEFDYKNTFL